MTHGVAENFAPHFAPSPTFVDQWIEQQFPNPQVAGPIHGEDAKTLCRQVGCHKYQGTEARHGR